MEGLNQLISAIGNLRISQTAIDLENVREALNKIVDYGECVDLLFTKNTDKLPFGVMVTPSITPDDINSILMSGEEIKVHRYFVEIDSKSFNYDLEDIEIAAILLFNIHHLVDTVDPIQRLRNTIDMYFTSTGTQLHIKDSIQYQQILTLGLIDTLIKFTNCLYIDSEVVTDAYMISIGLGEEFASGIQKLYNIIPGFTNVASRSPMLIILDWCFRLYSNVAHERIPAINQLKRSKEITASVLYNRFINNAIDSLYKIDTDSLVMESLDMLLESKRNSLFSQIKYNGLRGLEDDFYEFMIRARNADTEEDVMYALKQINIRLSILDDYLRNEQSLSEEEKKRWTDLYIKYRNIRDDIANKKVYNKRNYGVFFDYNRLDEDDD